MSFTLQDIAWHRAIGQQVEALDAPDFWIRLMRLLGQYVPFDSWLVLLFSQGRPQVFAKPQGASGDPDPLVEEYLRGLYLLDPFYIHSRDHPHSGLFRLADVAPECFEKTDYYRRYFRLNVVADEIQINVCLPGERTLCLSLGSRQPFSQEQFAVLRLIHPWVAALMRQRLPFESDMMNEPMPPEPAWQCSLERAAQRMGTPLTARELEVGRLMLSGCSNKEIAHKLQISAETVKVHRKHMYCKLGIKSQSELFGLFLQAQD